MKARVLFLLLLTLSAHHTAMSQGTLLPPRPVKSHLLGAPRTIRVYLPPSYDRQPRRRYPVLYLHDGQNVFSTAGTNACFGWGGWNLDQAVDRLMAEGRMREIIIVGVDNSRSRYAEYRGPLGLLDPGAKSKTPAFDSAATNFDRYAAFLVTELKPLVDREFRTLRTPAHTAVMGASLGGICSLALAWTHPKAFGAAASLSGSFQIENQSFLENVLRPALKKPGPFRVYLDSGVIDFTGDDDGKRWTAKVAAELRRLGWKEGKDLLHFVDDHLRTDVELAAAGLRRDKWEEAKRSQHNEFYWRQRAWRALTFLFPPTGRSN